jgi:hypothetical protein
MRPHTELSLITACMVAAVIFAIVVHDTVSITGSIVLVIGVGFAWLALIRWNGRPRP